MSLMPMNVSVGAILIGAVFMGAYGIYIYSKVSDRNIRSKRKSNEICPVCEKKVDLDNFTNSVTCKGCARVICKKSTCSDWIATNNECDSCSNNRKIHNRAGEWLLKQLNQRFRVTTAINFDEVVLKNSKFNNSINDKENNTTNLIPLDQREKVRQFLEELLSSMLETTSLNHVPVGQLYKSSEYLPIWDHECPGISHIELKCLITKIISEAVKLPELIFDYGELVRPIEDLPYFDPKRYQELLATAVLNKIVQSYRNPQNEHRPENFTEIPYDSDNDVEKGKKLLEISVTANYIEPELMSNITDDLTEQPMSITIEEQIEEISIDDSPTNSGSFSSNVSKNDETNLSDYLQKHHVPLPDLSTESDTNDDDILSLRSNGTDATWEDNWLFKSRKLKTEPSIGMLVPSPTENVRTLIGDKNADEISDLSEAGSDVEDAPSDSTDEGISVPNILIQNKKIIGGKHDLESFENLKKDTDPQLSESLISLSASSDSNVAEAKNDTFLIENNYIKVDIPLIDIEFDTLKKIPKESKENEAINSVILDNENNYNTKENIINVNEQNLIDIATNDDIIEENKLTNTALTDDDTKTNGINIVKQSPPIPGSIAEREHLKWENAAPIANNPYSPEVLQNRLNQRTPTNCIDLRNVPKINEEPAETPSSPEKLQDIFKAEQPIYKRFGRDYYINEAKKASGERKRRSEMNLRLSSPDDQEFDHSESPTDKQIRTRSKSATDENLNENIFAARPIQVNEDDPILQQATKIESLSTDDRDFYLLPVNTLHSLTSSDSSIVSPLLESLSEDSDSARIYDIKTCEKKIIRQNLEEPQNCTISEIIIDERQTPVDFVVSELLNIPEIYQETKEDNSLGSNSVEIVINNNKHNHHQEIKLPKEDIKNKKMEDEIATVISIHEPEINENNNGHPENNHQVIEEELINALPSVKLLAKTFSVKKETEPILPINRPKTIAWQPKSSEIYRSTSSMNSSPESFAPQYNQNYHPVSPGYSITARSISKQFREELKDSGSSNGTTTEMKDIQIIRSQSPPRTPSPVPIPGQLKNSIAFFENLKNK